MRLHINVDHVATVRNARGTPYPDPVEAAKACLDGGAAGITIHLREDRRHIVDDDVRRMRELGCFLNLESAATPEMLSIAREVRPDIVTLVPEKREERTTEGGLDVVGGGDRLRAHIEGLMQVGIPVSLFIEADAAVVEACARLGVRQIELHTGAYAEAEQAGEREPIRRAIEQGARLGRKHGLEVAAGHGLNRENVAPIARIAEIAELNIGHAVIADAILLSMKGAVVALADVIREARAPVAEV